MNCKHIRINHQDCSASSHVILGFHLVLGLHIPYCEQQLPNELPAHVNPLLPPQLPSVDTLTADALTVDVGCGAEVERDFEVVVLVLVQLPKAGLQPVWQCPAEDPHHPYCEQQLPNSLFKQVKPLVPPQDPSVETVAAVAIPAQSSAAENVTKDFMLAQIRLLHPNIRRKRSWKTFDNRLRNAFHLCLYNVCPCSPCT